MPTKTNKKLPPEDYCGNLPVLGGVAAQIQKKTMAIAVDEEGLDHLVFSARAILRRLA